MKFCWKRNIGDIYCYTYYYYNKYSESKDPKVINTLMCIVFGIIVFPWNNHALRILRKLYFGMFPRFSDIGIMPRQEMVSVSEF